MNYKIAQFILTPGQKSQSILEIYVAQPDAVKEALAGKLFLLIEIESARAENLKIINFLINTLNYNYYQNEKMILRERLSSIKIEHIFESALAKTNKKLAEFLQSEKIKLNPEILNITAGAIHNDGLHFSNLGKNKALLIYKNKTENSSKYKLADITGQTASINAKKSAGMNPVKLFANVVSGSLPRGGYFIFVNETFSEYLSAKQIIEIITALPPAGAAEQIKNTLGKINAYVPFLGLIIKNTTGLEAQEIKIKEPAPSTKSSINNLIVTEDRTEKLLTPSGLINVRKWTSFFKNPPESGKSAFSLKDKIFAKKKNSWFKPAKIFSAAKRLFVLSAKLFVFIFKAATDKKILSDSFISLFSRIKTNCRKLLFWYKNLNKINKILFSGLLLSLLLFTASLGWQNIKNQRIKEREIISGLIAAIQQKQNQIDASLLYDNEAGAKKLLDEVKELLAGLPQKDQAGKEKYDELAAKHLVQIEKISRVIRAKPLELANFKNLDSEAAPSNIIMIQEKIYAADAARKTIYVFDRASKLITALDLTGQNISRLDFPNIDKSNSIYYLNQDKLAVLNVKTEKLSGLEVDFGDGQRKIVDLKQYNNRLYFADAASGQIYRFSKSGGGLLNGAAWLNQREDLTNAGGMDIDGEIYLLKNNGELSKYSRGIKQEFALSAVEPALNQAVKISAGAEQNNIYIFEPANNRLAVFNKQGKFIRQYKPDGLYDLKDFQVDEKSDKIYFLNDAAIYSVDLTKTE